MLDTERPGAMSANNGRLQFEAMTCRTTLQIKSWLPEHRAGNQSITFDGRELPREVGATLSGPVHALCLGPGEWLLVSDEQAAPSIAERAAGDLAAQGAVLVDATDGTAALSIRGALARDVLSKGCGLDLRPHAFPAGRCARTRFAQIPAIIDHIDDARGFRVYVARSHLAYLADWIEDAAVEFNHGSP